MTTLVVMTNDLLASVALAGLASYGLVAIVARSILQRRRTGSTGWRGVHGRPGSVEWWAGIMMAVAVLGLLAAPAIALFDPSAWVGTWRLGLGGLLYGLGFILTVRAQLQMGDAWRIGVQQGERTELRTDGLFAWCRNPIFTAMLITALAMVVWVPLSLPAWLALWAGLQLQVRFVEEPHLRRLHAEAYLEYAARTGRFWPGIGRGTTA